MAIREKWMPSPHYSSPRGPYNKIVFHTTEGAMTIESLGSWFANPSAKCSSHHGADNTSAGLLGAYVYESNNAWTQGNANPYCLSLEMCAYASWSRDTWLKQKNTLLNNSADWLRYMVDKYKIPWTVLNNSQAQNPNTKGICQHINFGSWGSGHVDCGSGFPLDEVIKRAKGGSSTTPPSDQGIVGINMPAVTIVNSKLHMAAVWNDGRVHYQFESAGWYPVDDPNTGFKAKSGADITVNPATGLLVIAVTGLDSNVYTFQQRLPDPGDVAAVKGKWAKYGRGGWNSVR
jgi:hypothetical protein